MRITANGIQLEYQEFGAITGIPLVLIRGLGTQMVYWPTELVSGFADLGYRVIVFDNRDVGLSDRCPDNDVSGDAQEILAMVERDEEPKAAYTLDDMALDVIGLLDALNIDKAHIFGISMGGGIAQLLVCHHPQRILSGTIVMTAARSPGFDVLKRLLVYPETREEHQETWVRSFHDFGSPGFPVSDDYLRHEAGLAWDRGYDADGVNRQALATLLSKDRRDALRSVTVPCLVIHGAQDTLIPLEVGKEIAAIIPKSEFSQIEGMGHVITPLLSPLILDQVDSHIKRTLLS